MGLAIVASPAVAFTMAVVATGLVLGGQRLFQLRDGAPPFRYGRLLSAAAVSLGRGANDAQRSWGSIS